MWSNPNITIEGNLISNSTDGFVVDNQTSGSVRLFDNSFTGIAAGHHALLVGGASGADSGTAYGTWGGPSTVTVDASGNWWGTSTAAGVAGTISGDVDYTPRLDSGANGISSGPGFQGDFSTLDVGAVVQTGSSSRIQEAIGLLASGGTVNVAAGTYGGNVDATAKAVTLAAEASPWQVNITGDLTLNSDDTLVVAINGATAGTQYDQWVVSGTAALGGATADVTVGSVAYACGGRVPHRRGRYPQRHHWHGQSHAVDDSGQLQLHGHGGNLQHHGADDGVRRR